jgi:EAL domain-containing protein (putative c-di-GMP-specific phosphodiesterase class I)
VRSDDTVSRVGGDEFTILFPELSRGDDAARMAQKILEAVAQPFTLEGHDIYVTTSIGISLFPSDGEDAESLLKNADSAMYRAKDQGRNTYQLCTPGMSVRALERMALENRLRRALERDEFVLHYQPFVDMGSGAIVGLEALLRWQHPERGLLEPDMFIPLAEESRLILPVGEWALRTACEQMRRWQDAGFQALRLAVNLSARQFQQQDLVPRIERILEQTGLPASSLELEVTESIAMQNAEWTIGVLRLLRAMGVRISIDDFGSGQSSLSYLKYFPLSTVKIDRSFVKDIAVDPDDEAIVTAVIALAHSLKLKVIAEGVETEEQLAFLRQAQCDECQGYLYSRPRPAEEMLAMLKARLG